MATIPTKTIQTALLAWQDVNSLAEVIGSALDVSTMWECTIVIRIARRTGTGFTAGSPNIRIEAASVASPGTGDWGELIPAYTPLVGASIVNTTLNGAVSAADTTFVVTSATNIAVGDKLFLGHSSAANYEIVRVKVVSGTTITPEAAVQFAHATLAIVTDQAEIQVIPGIDLKAVTQIRAVADNLGSGQNMSAFVGVITMDSFA